MPGSNGQDGSWCLAVTHNPPVQGSTNTTASMRNQGMRKNSPCGLEMFAGVLSNIFKII